MTWSHSRGLDPMRALAAAAAGPGPLRVDGPPVVWSSHTLSGFESTPLTSLASEFDLVVIDHPHLGEAARSRALCPLEDLLGAEELRALSRSFVGDAYDSYHYADRQWALPIDAAAQVCAVSKQLPVEPQTWERVRSLFDVHNCAVPTAGPHLLLTFLGLCAALDPRLMPDAEGLVEPSIGVAALDVLRFLIERTPRAWRDCDPIQLLDAMCYADGPALVPLIFGYVTYSRPAEGQRVRFVDAPVFESVGARGSVLGGAGLAVTSRGRGRAGVIGHLRQAVTREAQTGLIPDAGGQPASAAAWRDDHVNRTSLEFYRGTSRTQAGAWRRPRHVGWIGFQSAGSQTLREALLTDLPSQQAVRLLNDQYRVRRPAEAEN